MLRLLSVGLLACTCLQPALAAPITYAEASDGDLAHGPVGFSLPVLAFQIGTNTVEGVFAGGGDPPPDLDSFAFSIPSGTVLVSGAVSLIDLSEDIQGSVWRFESGTNIVGQGASLGTVSSLSPGSGTVPGTPLGAGTYTMIHFTFDGSGSAGYVFSFEVAPVPAPATALMLGAGLAALGFARRRRSA